GLVATGFALALGSMAAFAIHRFRFFGRESVSFLLLLPIALPGIITGMALNSFYVFAKVPFSMWTIVIGHATFCVVVVYNNVLAFVPVVISQRLTRDTGVIRRSAVADTAGAQLAESGV